MLYYFFFFQAEDGIRDLYVTGVQTCALPISEASTDERGAGPRPGARRLGRAALPRLREQGRRLTGPNERRADARARGRRSEERRVGKECRSRWSRYH